MYNPGTHANYWVNERKLADFDEAEIGEMFMSHAMIDHELGMVSIMAI